MFEDLPQDPAALTGWSWPAIKPYYKDLAARPLKVGSLAEWLADWSSVGERVDELYNRLYIATTINTADAEAETLYERYLDGIYPNVQEAENNLKQKLVDSGLVLPGFEIPQRNMRAEVSLFRPANVPLLVKEQKLTTEYNRLIGAQTVTWEDREVTLTQLRGVSEDPDRSKREQAWRLSAERMLADRGAVNTLWQKFLRLRLQIAANAGLGDYRAYRWQQLMRFDYTPKSARMFHRAIEEAVVPAATRLYERRRKRLGVDTLRPWDLDVDPYGRPPLHPFPDVTTLKNTVSEMFHRLDLQLGEYYDVMGQENLLDLENRKNKAPGGYCNTFAASRRPFIFMNATGLQDDVQTLLHESGHAFNLFESAHLPYFKQLEPSMEFAEVASMSMELLAGPYLAKKSGGFYDDADTARARATHLEELILFWPYMAVVDAFQHWVYENPDQAMDPACDDAVWADLSRRFMPGIDWTTLEDALVTGWHRKLHIHTSPFYYIEYGLAQLGAVQIWRNSLQDASSAVAAYRHALSLGGTLSLPALYLAAGARLAFDAQTLGEAVLLIETTLDKLEGDVV